MTKNLRCFIEVFFARTMAIEVIIRNVSRRVVTGNSGIVKMPLLTVNAMSLTSVSIILVGNTPTLSGTKSHCTGSPVPFFTVVNRI